VSASYCNCGEAAHASNDPSKHRHKTAHKHSIEHPRCIVFSKPFPGDPDRHNDVPKPFYTEQTTAIGGVDLLPESVRFRGRDAVAAHAGKAKRLSRYALAVCFQVGWASRPPTNRITLDDERPPIALQVKRIAVQDASNPRRDTRTPAC
jgi:hypothetical protein